MNHSKTDSPAIVAWWHAVTTPVPPDTRPRQLIGDDPPAVIQHETKTVAPVAPSAPITRRRVSIAEARVLCDTAEILWRPEPSLPECEQYALVLA